jgi:hypothetical protein
VHYLLRMYYGHGNCFGQPDGTPSDMGQLKVHFGPFGHSVNLNAI